MEATAAWDEMIAGQNARDTAGLMQLVRAGRAFVVDGGTRAKLLEVGVFSRRVRILEGPHAGKAGWVQEELRVLARLL
jgi:hypothetical protein